MILVTGSSGFLGKELVKQFNQSGLVKLGRANTDIICDLSCKVPDLPGVCNVIHAAGKAHVVPRNETDENEFFDVNVKGTENLLRGLEQADSLPRSFVFISTVAVYGAGSGKGLDESTGLNATDPYGRSKIHAEKIIQEWCTEHNVICGILRLPLLVGPNPPGNLGAMIRGIKRGYYFNIAGGVAKKSMVMAEDVAKIIPKLAEVGGIFNLTDGYHPNFFELSKNIGKQFKRKDTYNIPLWLAKFFAKIGDNMQRFPINSNKLAKITSDLTFDDSKARRELGWNPSKVLDKFFIK